MTPLSARIAAKRVAEFLESPANHPVESCSSCCFNIYRLAFGTSNGLLLCTLTGDHERRHNAQFARKQSCPIPSFGGDESWRDGKKWRSIANGVSLCPACNNAIGLIGYDFMSPCPYCGQHNLRKSRA